MVSGYSKTWHSCTKFLCHSMPKSTRLDVFLPLWLRKLLLILLSLLMKTIILLEVTYSDGLNDQHPLFS